MFATLVRLVREYQKKPRVVVRRPAEIKHQGLHFNLAERLIFVVENYLDQKPEKIPSITWFGSKMRKAGRRRLLGVYYPLDHQIKIHRILDEEETPEYFIDYIIYHEVLHALFPPLKKRTEVRRIHHFQFRKEERRFPHYKRAKEWEKQNKHRLLTI